MQTDRSPPPIKGAHPGDGINLKEIWNVLVRNWLLIAAVTSIVAGGAVVT